MRTVVRIESNGSPEDIQAIHETVLKTSPMYCSVVRPIRIESELSVE